MMTTADPVRIAHDAKRISALQREARGVVRRLDRLVAAAGDDPVRGDLAALRTAAEGLVSQLAHREQTLQRQARDAVRRVR